MGPRVGTADLVERLTNVIGPRASVARGVLDQHGASESYYRALPPDIVVFPETTEEVREIVRVMRDDLWPAVESGKLTLPIYKTFKLADLVEALAVMTANQHFGKIVINVP